MAKLFVNSRDPDQTTFCGVWSGSALFAKYHFKGLQTKMVNIAPYLVIILDNIWYFAVK